MSSSKRAKERERERDGHKRGALVLAPVFSPLWVCHTLERGRPFSTCLHDVCRAVVALGRSEGGRCRALAHPQYTALSVQGALYHSSPLRACSCCSLALLPDLTVYLVVKRYKTHTHTVGFSSSSEVGHCMHTAAGHARPACPQCLCMLTDAPLS
jgi:hypothetical protein